MPLYKDNEEIRRLLYRGQRQRMLIKDRVIRFIDTDEPSIFPTSFVLPYEINNIDYHIEITYPIGEEIELENIEVSLGFVELTSLSEETIEGNFLTKTLIFRLVEQNPRTESREATITFNFENMSVQANLVQARTVRLLTATYHNALENNSIDTFIGSTSGLTVGNTGGTVYLYIVGDTGAAYSVTLPSYASSSSLTGTLADLPSGVTVTDATGFVAIPIVIADDGGSGVDKLLDNSTVVINNTNILTTSTDYIQPTTNTVTQRGSEDLTIDEIAIPAATLPYNKFTVSGGVQGGVGPFQVFIATNASFTNFVTDYDTGLVWNGTGAATNRSGRTFSFVDSIGSSTTYYARVVDLSDSSPVETTSSNLGVYEMRWADASNNIGYSVTEPNLTVARTGSTPTPGVGGYSNGHFQYEEMAVEGSVDFTTVSTPAFNFNSATLSFTGSSRLSTVENATIHPRSNNVLGYYVYRSPLTLASVPNANAPIRQLIFTQGITQAARPTVPMSIKGTPSEFGWQADESATLTIIHDRDQYPLLLPNTSASWIDNREQNPLNITIVNQTTPDTTNVVRAPLSDADQDTFLTVDYFNDPNVTSSNLESLKQYGYETTITFRTLDPGEDVPDAPSGDTSVRQGQNPSESPRSDEIDFICANAYEADSSVNGYRDVLTFSIIGNLRRSTVSAQAAKDSGGSATIRTDSTVLSKMTYGVANSNLQPITGWYYFSSVDAAVQFANGNAIAIEDDLT